MYGRLLWNYGKLGDICCGSLSMSCSLCIIYGSSMAHYCVWIVYILRAHNYISVVSIVTLWFTLLFLWLTIWCTIMTWGYEQLSIWLSDQRDVLEVILYQWPLMIMEMWSTLISLNDSNNLSLVTVIYSSNIYDDWTLYTDEILVLITVT